MAESTISFSGLGSGLDTASMVDQLIALESVQQTKLKTQVTQNQSKVTQYQTLNTQFSSIKSAAEALNIPSAWKLNKATSSDTSVSVSADASALSGSLTFTVKNLATAQTLASYGTVASTSTSITAASSSFLIGQSAGLGLGNISGNLSAGAHTIAVTQASAGAVVNGAPVADSVTLTGTETLTANIDGVAKSFTLQAGTYNQQQLSEMLTQVSGNQLNVTTNANKSLHIATTHEGSVASLSITGGTGLAALGLSTTGTVNGTNGIVTVDGVATTVTNVKPDGSNSVVLNGGVTASFAGGLRVGTSTVNSVSTGTGSLADIVSNINGANLGITASAVQVAPNQYKLQVQSKATGSAGTIAADFSAFSGALGSLQTITAAKDATIQIGGASGYSITSSSNTIAGALPGVTINLTSADPTKSVTVNVGGDVDGIAAKVQKLIDAANTALTNIKNNSKYDAATKTGGPLQGNSTARRLQQSLFNSISYSVQGSSLSPSAVGITSNADGTFSFDKTKFATAYNADPEAVVGVFIEGGTTGVSTLSNPGIAERLATMAKSAVDSVSGLITTSINGVNSTIKDLNDQITKWDDRLAIKRANLKRQFSAMDSAVATLKNQGNWLTGQIAGLSSNS